MIKKTELRRIARARLWDAVALYRAKRFDSAVYLCGYAIETALKARICTTLKWPEFPSNTAEFRNYQSFRTHDLDVLLSLSGSEKKVKTRFLADWSVVAKWNPEARYGPIGALTRRDAGLMIGSTKILLRVI